MEIDATSAYVRHIPRFAAVTVRQVTAALAIMCWCGIIGPAASAADLDEKLAQLRIGIDDRDRVVSVMGKPSTETHTNLLGVFSRTRMTWTPFSLFSSRTYAATLVWGRLVSVQVCQSTKDCD